MTNRTLTGFLLLAVAAGLSGCDGGTPVSPTAPAVAVPQTPAPPAPTPDGYAVADVTLSGMVYEETPMGRVPIEGVFIRSDWWHMFPTPDVVTDSRGFFSFRRVWVCPCSSAPWVDAGITALWVDKDGYQAPAGQPFSVFDNRPGTTAPPDRHLRDVTIDGDTRFDIQLVRR
jgi:hypothetical protein